MENEIGGVIVGSLVAAQQAAPLTRQQYQEDLRSNVGRKTDSDVQRRDKIYEEYEQYRIWKVQTKRYDVGDIVMRLLQEDWKEESFSSRKFSLFFHRLHQDESFDLRFRYLTCAFLFIPVSVFGRSSRFFIRGNVSTVSVGGKVEDPMDLCGRSRADDFTWLQFHV